MDIGPHATAPYGMIRVALAVPFVDGSPQIPTAALTVGIHNASGGALVGGALTIAPGDVPADGFVHVIVGRIGTAASLASGTSYYLEFATASTVPWNVYGIYTG